jgi:predicted nucleotidyltransferase
MSTTIDHLIEVVDIEEDLGQLFGGRKVDLVNRKYLNARLKDRILATEALQYEGRYAS